MTSVVGSSEQITSINFEQYEYPFVANVPHNYYYAVSVYVASTGHIAHNDPGYVDQGIGAGGTYCAA